MNKLYYLSALILTLLAVPLVSYAHCKGKHTGDHEHCSGSGNPGSTNLGDDYTWTDGVTFISPSDVGSFDYHIIGTPGEDDIYAGGGKDLIAGVGGNDQIFARGGDDEIHGGSGDVRISGGAGNDLIFGGEDGHNISGDEGDDIIFGGDGGGGIDGGEGTDWLEGGDADDWLTFSLGSLIALPDQYEVDHYDGNLGNDTLTFLHTGTEEDNAVGVSIDMYFGTYEASVRDQFGTPVAVNGDFSSIERFNTTDGADFFIGIENVDVSVSASAGNDIIQTFGGNDSIDAGYGDDVVYAGDGDDFIRAEAGNDVIYGEGGNDVISGYGGGNFGNATRQDDELYGGEGCDVFTFSRPGGDQIDTIMDFDYPYDEAPCERINFSFSDYWRVDFRDLDIETVGNDIIIDLVVRHGGGEHLTVILKDAVINGVTVDESTFTFEYPNF